MLKTITTIDQGIARVEMILALACTGTLTVIMTTQVFLRYFLNAPLFWAEEISVQLLVFATIFGLSLLVHRAALVSIDFLPKALGSRQRRGLLALLGMLTMGLFLLISVLSWDWIRRPEVQLELGASTQLPKWYNYTVLPVGMALMAWHQAVHVLQDSLAFIRGDAQ